MEKVSFTSKPPFCNSMLGSDEFNLNETVIPHCKSRHEANFDQTVVVKILKKCKSFLFEFKNQQGLFQSK